MLILCTHLFFKSFFPCIRRTCTLYTPQYDVKTALTKQKSAPWIILHNMNTWFPFSIPHHFLSSSSILFFFSVKPTPSRKGALYHSYDQILSFGKPTIFWNCSICHQRTAIDIWCFSSVGNETNYNSTIKW